MAEKIVVVGVKEIELIKECSRILTEQIALLPPDQRIKALKKQIQPQTLKELSCIEDCSGNHKVLCEIVCIAIRNLRKNKEITDRQINFLNNALILLQENKVRKFDWIQQKWGLKIAGLID
jgi:hypothetical protein